MALQEDGSNLNERSVKRLELDPLPLSHGCQESSLVMQGAIIRFEEKHLGCLWTIQPAAQDILHPSH